MKLVKLSVKRPVGVIMIVLAIIALGFVSVRNLAVDLLPEIDLPIAVVATTYTDAAPEEIESTISKPLESAISSIEGIEGIQSQSQADSSLVIMMFKNGTDLDQALLDVRERVDQVKGALPDRAGDPNIMRFSPDQLPVMWVGLTGKDAGVLTELAEEEVVPYFERQSGVASVSVEGGKTREIQLILDEAAMLSHKINTEDVEQALQGTNRSASVGRIDKGTQDLQVRVQGEFESLEDIRRTLILTEDGNKVHIEDIAKVTDAYKKESSLTLVNGEPSVVLSALKNSDANTVDVARNLDKSIKHLNKELPEGAKLQVVIDTSDFIEESVDSVISNILIGGAISVFILLLFLKSVRATIVIAVSIPIAVISTFALMYFTGETLNVLTLGGLALGLGMMVDSSIVILENIFSYRQKGYNLVDSAIKGASELAPAVIASTTTTLVVFLPIVYVEGIASDMFTPLALTVSFSLLASLVVAVTLVPMLSSKLLTEAVEDGKRYWFDQFLEKVNNLYQALLEKVLKFRKTSVIVTLLLIGLSVAATPLIGAEFIPAGDQGQMEIKVETGASSSLAHTEAVADQVTEKLNEFSDIVDVSFISIGGGGFDGTGTGTNQASYTIELVPAKDRDMTTAEFVLKLDQELADIVGAEITVSEMEAGMGMGDPIQIELTGAEHEVLREISEQVEQDIKEIDGVFNPKTDAEDAIPQMKLTIDEEKAATFGLVPSQITSQIEMQFIGQTATVFRDEGQEVDVSLMYPEDEKTSISDLQDMKLTAPSGVVPLNEVVEFKEVLGPVKLVRQNQEAQMTVTSEIAERDLGGVVSDIETYLDGFEFPDGYSYNIGGQAEDMAESFADLTLALVFSIFLVYAVMAIQFENFLFPFIIMFSMPATVIGVVGGLLVSGLAFSIPAFIGIIMLAGIVVNNSIVLVDYINILRERGMKRYDAIIEAGRSRLRPILMTTLTTVLAMVPLGLGLGEGAEMQQPLAVTIIFGLSVSSFFTLLLIPIVYTFFDDLTNKLSRKKKEEN